MNEITRLEDLSEDLQKQMIDLYWRGGSFIKGLSTDILERRYIQMNTRGDMCLTSDGAALVADYQQRQQSPATPASEPPTPATRYTHASAQAISELSMNMTVLVTDNWTRFQYTGEGREVIADRMDNQITRHLDILDDELIAAKTELAAAQQRIAELAAELTILHEGIQKALALNYMGSACATGKNVILNQALDKVKALKDTQS